MIINFLLHIQIVTSVYRMNKVTVKPTEHATGKDFYVWSIHQVHISIDHDSHIRAIISYSVVTYL